MDPEYEIAKIVNRTGINLDTLVLQYPNIYEYLDETLEFSSTENVNIDCLYDNFRKWQSINYANKLRMGKILFKHECEKILGKCTKSDKKWIIRFRKFKNNVE